jgi:hypothetical protein
MGVNGVQKNVIIRISYLQTHPNITQFQTYAILKVTKN